MNRKAIAALLLASSLSGCMGHNGLVDRVMKFNLSTTENRWARQGLFLGMWIVPVYPVCTLVDVLVLNSVEFWSGKNPMNGRSAVVDVPESEIRKLGLEAIEVARVERLDATHAALHV